MTAGLTLTMIRCGDTLVPSCEMFREDLHRLPEGVEIVISTKRPRSARHLRTFFGKLRSAIDLGFWDSDTDSLLSYIKIGIGHCISVIDTTSTMVSTTVLTIAERVLAKHGPASDEGRLARAVIELSGPRSWLVPKSISFAELDQDSFNDFNERADKFLAERLGVDPDALFRHMVDKTASPADAPVSHAEKDNATPASAKSALAERPLDERLAALGFELGTAETPGGFDALWAAAKGREDVRALYREAPETLGDIVQAAREKAKGDLAADAFERMARNLAKAAVKRETEAA